MATHITLKPCVSIECQKEINKLRFENEVLKSKIKSLEERIVNVAKIGLQSMITYDNKMYELAVNLKRITDMDIKENK